MKNLIELKVKIYWKMYRFGEVTGIYRSKVINDYNKYATKSYYKGTYSKNGFMAYKRNGWRGYKKEDES